jgi:hypothetical protein
MTVAEKQTAPERELGGGEETEVNLLIFPTPHAAPAQAEEEEDWKFDWLNDPSVILRDQAGVAAYYNRLGELVVKQKGPFGDDPAIFVAPENISKFLAGIRDRAKRG